MADNTQPTDTPIAAVADEDDSNQRYSRSNSFHPVLYNFLVPPHNDHKYALPLPFAVLFDNLISVVWLTYAKEPATKIGTIGVNQVQWALELMKCMRVDNRYSESIDNVVKELEKRLIELYAKVNGKLYAIRKQREEELDDERESQEYYSKTNAEELKLADCDRVSYNETDVTKKLDVVDVPIDSVTGEAKWLKELNALGRRKSSFEENCNLSNKPSSKTSLIGALQNIKTKTRDVTTKTDVELLIKELKSSPATEKK